MSNQSDSQEVFGMETFVFMWKKDKDINILDSDMLFYVKCARLGRPIEIELILNFIGFSYEIPTMFLFPDLLGLNMQGSFFWTL